MISSNGHEGGGEGRSLELPYPCPWSYTLIGRSPGEIRRAVTSIVGAADHRLSPSNRSSSGKYCSLVLDLTVENERQRLDLFEALRRHRDVLYVL